MKVKNSYEYFDRENVNELSDLADELIEAGENDLAKEVFEIGLLVMDYASRVGTKAMEVEKKLNKTDKFKGRIENKWLTDSLKPK